MGTEYNNSNLVTQIEAILYLKGKPTTCEEIGELTQAEEEAIESALIKLMSDYAHRPDSALEVVETPAGYALQHCVTVAKICSKTWSLLTSIPPL